MNTKTKKALSIGLPLILAVFFGWYTFSKLPIDAIVPYFKTANYSWIAIGTLCGFLSHLSRAYRWKYLINPMGYSLSLPNSIMAVFAGYLANLGIPRSGEVLRAAIITNYDKVPFEKTFGTIVAERVADMLILLTIVAVTLALQFEFIYELLEKTFQPQKLLIAGLVGILLLALLGLYLKKSKSVVAQKVRGFLTGLIEGALSILNMQHKWAFIGHTLFIWVMYLAMFYLTALSVSDLDGMSIGAILIAFIAGSFTVAATNGGVFVYPIAVAAALEIFDFALEPSMAFGWIMWSSQALMVIICGSLSFLLLPIYNRRK